MTTWLSPHFALDEMIVSQEGARRNIDNSPPADVLAALKRTAQGLEEVRVRLGGVPILVSSGYRSPALNKAIGGARNSQHMRGEAADFTAPRFGTPRAIVDALADSAVPFDQLIHEFGRWVHISFVATNPRREVLAIDASGTRPFFA